MSALYINVVEINYVLNLFYYVVLTALCLAVLCQMTSFWFLNFQNINYMMLFVWSNVFRLALVRRWATMQSVGSSRTSWKWRMLQMPHKDHSGETRRQTRCIPYLNVIWSNWYLDISPGISPHMNRSTLAEITVISPTSIYKPHYFHNRSFKKEKSVFHQMWGSLSLVFGLLSSLYHIFATQTRFISSLQLLVNEELFHQSSFCLINIVSSVQLLCKERYLHFSGGGKSPRGKCPRPYLIPSKDLN